VTPDGKTAWVALGGGALVPIDVATNTAGQAITSTQIASPREITITPDGKTLWVANQSSVGGQNVITPFDLATRTFGTAIQTNGFAGAPRFASGQGAADLALPGSAPAAGSVGSTLSYTLTATNNGPDVSTVTTLTDPLPAGVTFVSATTSQGTCT